MIQLKSCPRCNGDMLVEELLGEVEVVCLQCGCRMAPQVDSGSSPRQPALPSKRQGNFPGRQPLALVKG